MPIEPAQLASPTIRRSQRQLLWHTTSADPALVDTLWNTPDELTAQGHPLKDQPRDRCTVMRLDSCTPACVIKRYNLRGPLHTAAHLLIRSRARWSWINARRVLDAGLRTPAPIALLEQRAGAARLRSFLVTDHIDAQPLDAVLADPHVDPQRLPRLVDEMAEVWRGLGRARLAHRDMKASNFLVDSNDQIWLIDLDAVRGITAAFARRRSKDRERFLLNWADRPEIATAFRSALEHP